MLNIKYITMGFQIGDIVQFKSLDLDYVSKDTWERIGRLSNLDSKYSLGHDYEVISILGNYLVIRSNGGTTFNIPKKYFIKNLSEERNTKADKE